jgi:hypothetical protein
LGTMNGWFLDWCRTTTVPDATGAVLLPLGLLFIAAPQKARYHGNLSLSIPFSRWPKSSCPNLWASVTSPQRRDAFPANAEMWT